MAARVAGVHRVFKMGGAHAIAALAYGTETRPARRQDRRPRQRVRRDRQAPGLRRRRDRQRGRADRGADRRRQDARHRPGWRRICSRRPSTTRWPARCSSRPRRAWSRGSRSSSRRQLKTLERAKHRHGTSLAARGAIIVAKNLDECLALANRYAPEHLVLAVRRRRGGLEATFTNAGAIFLGHYTPVAVGDYLAGPNHVLPTGGTARFFSPLGVEDFLKRTSVIALRAAEAARAGRGRDPTAAARGADGARRTRWSCGCRRSGGRGASARLPATPRRRSSYERAQGAQGGGRAQDHARPTSASRSTSTEPASTRSRPGSPSSTTCSSPSRKHGLFDLRLRRQGRSRRSTRTTRSRTSASRSGQAFREALGARRGHPALRILRAPDGGGQGRGRGRHLESTVPRVSRWSSPTIAIGNFDASLTEDFLYAFSQNAGLDLHVELRYGRSPHHVVEAIFKGAGARAARGGRARPARARACPR